MAHSVKFLSLQKSELEYEVAIRGATPADTVRELREQIAKLGPLFPSEDILESVLSVGDDLKGVSDALIKLRAYIEAPSDGNALLRARNLINHLHHRLNRIVCDSTTQQGVVDTCVSEYRRLLERYNAITATDSTPSLASRDPQSTAALPLNVNVTCERGVASEFTKFKFDGKSCVRAFIQRINEYSQSRNIPGEKLLSYCAEIFTGDALHWYRAIRDQVSNWDELVSLLREDFDQADYDYRLLSEIRARTQGESENITIYISIMTGLFSRLSKSLSNEDKLEIILHNIRPCYASTLASVPKISDLDTLRSLCRNYENIQARLVGFHEPPKVSSGTLAPEFAYAGQSASRFNQGSGQSFNKRPYNNFYNKSNNNYNTVDTILLDKPLHDPRPYACVQINDFKLFGLLDSGSAVSILGDKAYRKLEERGLQLHRDNLITVTAAGGQSMTSIGYMFLPINFENEYHIIKSFVVPDINIDLVLGIDFWREFNIFPRHFSSITFSNAAVLNASLSTDSSTFIQAYDHLTVSERSVADDIISQFSDISAERRGLGETSLVTHRIDTGDAEPVRQRYYRLSPEKQRILAEQVDEMLALDVIEQCESAWSSPVLIVTKKNGQPRFCLDSRKLNSITKRDAYSLPYISEILDNLRDARYLSSIDLSKAFWQIPIAQEDRDKTAFYVPNRGTYRFKRTAFGLTNAPATQQRLVDLLFREFDLKVFAYLDDIIIVSNDFNSHVSLLLRVLNKLKQANLTVNLEKCQFFRSQLKYLGYVVDSSGLRTDPEKVEAILNYPTPTCRKDVKRFLGTATWYCRFVPNFSTIAGPLNKLTSSKKGGPPFVWSAEADAAFKKLKECLVSAPVLSCPDYDKPFEVHTDASNYGVGAMLTQTIDGKEHPVAYMSKSLSAAERNYSITERETLAVVIALEHWRCYLENGRGEVRCLLREVLVLQDSKSPNLGRNGPPEAVF
ncbi:unnamed protein product [Parnassius apollo]|uniref:(apollo) hypothetical protein n=1 Tax=Parnassius apollo TaxID=110799 RepID=A0A8S3XQL9_PARAO|nr:unnamed protein product [Parnassius apollo]